MIPGCREPLPMPSVAAWSCGLAVTHLWRMPSMLDLPMIANVGYVMF